MERPRVERRTAEVRKPLWPHGLVLLVLAASCSTGAPPPEPVTETETPIRGGTVVEPIAEDIRTLRPFFMEDEPARRAVRLIYDSLVAPDPLTGEPRPRLATWDVSADARTYTLSLDQHAVWSDGTPVTAADFLTSVKALGIYLRSESLGGFSEMQPARLLDSIEGFTEFVSGADEIPGIQLDPEDPKRMTVTTTTAYCGAVAQVFMYPLLPTHVFGKYMVPSASSELMTAPELDAPPVASGPFVFGEWRRGDQLTLIRNEMYFRGAPSLDAYVFKVTPIDTWVDDLRRGALTYVPLSAIGATSLSSDPSVRVHSTTKGDYTFIAWNTQSRSALALRDRRVRQALAYGLDGELALRLIYEGVGERMDAHHPRGHWAHPGGLEPYDHDADRARALIEEAGYALGADGYYERDGRELAFTLKTNEGNKLRAALVQYAVDQYRALGVRVTPELVTFPELVTEVSERDTIEAVVLGWSLGSDPDPHGIWHSSQIPDPASGRTGFNLVGFSNAEMDSAIERARNGPDCSLAARQREYATFNRILNLEQPYYFGFVTMNLRAVSARLRGFVPAVYSAAWNSCCLDLNDVHKWWLAPEDQ